MTLADLVESVVGTSHEMPLTIDDAGVVIKNERRRITVDVVGRAPEPTTLREISEIIASAETEKPIPRISGKERKRVHTALYQTHLPTLDDLGVVEFDKKRGSVSRGPAFDQAQRVIEAVRDECSNGGDA